MRQILMALQHFHKQKIFFEIGNFTEKNIHLSAMYGKIFVDHGFYHEEDEEYPSYLEPPEQTKSEMSDIYACGFIFFRLATLFNSVKVQQIFDEKPKRRSSIILMIKENILKESPLISQTKAYFQNFKKSLEAFKV
jgi:hypothetical protein